MAHVSALESTHQKTMSWIHELRDLGDFRDESQAYTAMRAVLQALRDRLTVEEAAHVAAQLPMLVRGFYYEGWKPASSPVKLHKADEFYGLVSEKMSNGAQVNPKMAVAAVFSLLESKMAAGELDDVKHILPPAIRDLWSS